MDAFTVDTTSFVASNVLRLVDGKPTLITPEDEDPGFRERKCTPSDGEYTLIFSGISEPREEPNKFYDPEERGSKPFRNACWLEFTVVKGRNLTGRHFSNKMTWAFGERATMGKFLRKLNHGSLPTNDVWSIGEFLGRTFTATIAEANEKYSPIVIATVKPLDPPIGAPPIADEEPGITLDQAGVIVKYSQDVWGGKLKGKQNLMTLLEAMYDGKDLDDFTYDEADQLINYFETDADGIKAAVEQYENAEYADVPELQK